MTMLWDEPCLKKTRLLLKEMVDTVGQFGMGQKVSKENVLQITTDEYNRKWHCSGPDTSTFPIVDAVQLMFNMNLQQYQMIKTNCLKHGVAFLPGI